MNFHQPLLVAVGLLVASCNNQNTNDDEVVDTTLNDAARTTTNESEVSNAVQQVAERDGDEVSGSSNERASPPENDGEEAYDEEQDQEFEPKGAASAVGDVRTLFSGDDYPASAQAAGAEGTARAILTIGPDGRVVGCELAVSTFNAALDAATCNILRRRGRFVPARDSSGNPTTSTFTTPPITWRLEG